MSLRWRVDELAEGRGWGARQLAEAAGIDDKTARNILNSRATRVDLETISRLAAALGVAPGALWEPDDDQAEAWKRAAGAAGGGSADELADVLAGKWGDVPEPSLERASRLV